jgi:hypothetical protein
MVGSTNLPYQNNLVKINYLPEGEPILDENGEPKDLRYTPSYEKSQVRMPEAQRAMPEGEQGGDVTLTRLREIRDGLDENLTEREAIDELDFIINDAPSGYFPQDILNKVDQAKRDLEEEFTTWAGRGDSEASTESAISSVMSFLDSKESRGEAAPTRFMPEGVDEDKFYSQLERVITDKVPTRATAQQIMATIDPTRGSGVKADEIKWSGIEQALASLEKDGKVSKEDLLNYLRNEGMVRFEEVTLGEGRNAYEAERSRLGEQLGRGEITSQEYRRLTDELDSRTQEQPEAKFSQYVLPGGENYREVVLAMPIPPTKRKNWGIIYDSTIGRAQLGVVFKTKEEAQSHIDNHPNIKNPKVNSWDFEEESKPSYTSSHFPDIPNYVAHMRTNERTLDDGSEGLFVEEFQSDRHQAGRKKGYKEDTSPEDIEVAKKVKEDAEEKLQLREYAIREENGFPLSLKEIIASGRKVEYDSIRDADAVRTELKAAVEQARQRYATMTSDGQVADAPFRTTWPIQLFKRALRDAVDSGKDWIGWTTGETQNERFDLSKSLDSIEVRRIDGSNRVTVYGTKGNNNVITQQSTLEALPDVIGKELAEKVISDMSPKGTPQQIQRAKIAAEEARKKLQQPGVGYDSPLFDEYERKAEEFRVLNGKSDVSYSGLDLKVGGEGMKGFYDNMLPKEVGKYVKQFGGKVEKAAIEDVSDLKKYVETYDAWREYVDPDGYTSEAEFDAMSEAEKLSAVPRDGTTPSTPIWKVNITPEMRKISQTGQMRFMPEDYRGTHTAPTSESAPAHDLTGNGVYPADVYTRPDWYEQDAGLEEMKKIKRLKGNPNASITIYRAVPVEVAEEARKTGSPSKYVFRSGDWVTTSKQYAKDHGDSALQGEYRIFSKSVKAKDIYTDGNSIFEWGYNPAMEEEKTKKSKTKGNASAIANAAKLK